MIGRLAPKGFRRHLALTSALAVAVATAAGSFLVFTFTRQQLRNEMDETLEAFTDEAIEHPGPFAGQFEIVFNGGRLGGERGVAQFVTTKGNPLQPFAGLDLPEDAEGGMFDPLDPEPFIPINPKARAVAAGSRDPYYEDVVVDGTPLRVYTRQVRPGLAMQVAQPTDEINAVLNRVAMVLGGVVIGGTVLAALLGRAIAASAVRRVGKVTTVAEEVTAHGDFGRRLDVEGDDELSRLIETFNSLLEALEAANADQKQLFADASHELRTPITSMRTNIEVLEGSKLPHQERDRVVTSVHAQLDELSRLVDNLIELARSGGPPKTIQDIDLDEIVGDVVRRFEKLNPEANIVVRSVPYTTRGDPTRVQRAIQNIVDNALKWSPDGSPVEIEVAEGSISVSDRGPGIDLSDMPHIFDRFYRAATARRTPGSGLGLAITKDVVEGHGGTIVAINREEGGTTFTISLPVAG